MRTVDRLRRALLVVALATMPIAGCGIGPSVVTDSGQAPTGLAAGTTVFFVDGSGDLRPSTRDTGRLGTVHSAVQLLLTGPSGTEVDAGLHSDLPSSDIRSGVVDAGDRITIHLPFTADETGPNGVEQVVCTILAVVVASGRDPGRVRVSVSLTDAGTVDATCPVIT
ncbi:hypothetical protein CLV30_11381 [Haloactinopolyspora alba]|uniref:Copper(I)-binding protein n=1 Tax=Haloactinopolyspora alba TaxID=648780 RepID=A0A2P8DWJ7_9ACTN|nr:hypothetical protein [Haloactinopolyspora alba]PSL01593.1 hypothetical protein CLV30_11381 [Haloactinopolyspora alba]